MKQIPLIKEYRITRLVKCLECFDKYVYNREKQRDCILNLYPNKKGKSLEHREKSIFRGMVIPSLRYLGLIIGFEDLIKPSANGKLIIESQFNPELYKRTLRAIIYEVDEHIFGFLKVIGENTYSKETFIKELCNQIIASSDKQKIERIEKWLSILKQVELIRDMESTIMIDEMNYAQTLDELNPNQLNFNKFKKYLLKEYVVLAKDSAGVVDIRDLRGNVGIRFLKEDKVILTENPFDSMFEKFILTTKEYLVSLGEPMGADQKLFKYKNNFYKTVLITRKEEIK